MNNLYNRNASNYYCINNDNNNANVIDNSDTYTNRKMFKTNSEECGAIFSRRGQSSAQSKVGAELVDLSDLEDVKSHKIRSVYHSTCTVGDRFRNCDSNQLSERDRKILPNHRSPVRRSKINNLYNKYASNYYSINNDNNNANVIDNSDTYTNQKTNSEECGAIFSRRGQSSAQSKVSAPADLVDRSDLEDVKSHKARSVYHSTCTVVERFRNCDSNRLLEKDQTILSNHRSPIRRYQNSHPYSVCQSDGLGRSSLSVDSNIVAKSDPAVANATLYSSLAERVQHFSSGKSHTQNDRSEAPTSSKFMHHENRSNRATSGSDVSSHTVSKNPLLVAVIDRSDREGKISPSNWLELESRLLKAMADDSCERSEVRFNGYTWSQGIKIIKCTNKESLDFLKETINNIEELWPDARLAVVPQACLDLQLIVSVWIPSVFKNAGIVLKLLEKQNAGFITQAWEVISLAANKGNNGMDLRIAIDAESLEKMKTSAGKMTLGFKAIWFRHPDIPKCNTK